MCKMCTEQTEYLHNNRHKAAYARASNMLKTHTLHIHLLAHMNTLADTYWDSDHWWRDWELVIEEPERALEHSGHKCTQTTRSHWKIHSWFVSSRGKSWHTHAPTQVHIVFIPISICPGQIALYTRSDHICPACMLYMVCTRTHLHLYCESRPLYIKPVPAVHGKNLNKAFSPSHFFLWWTLSRLHSCFLPQQFLFYLCSPLFALFICIAVFLSNLFFHLSSQSPGLPSDSMPPDLSFSRENLSFDFKDTDMKRLSMEIEKEKWVAVLWIFRAFQKFVFLPPVYVV